MKQKKKLCIQAFTEAAFLNDDFHKTKSLKLVLRDKYVSYNSKKTISKKF
jgi:hypothetical protein